MGRSTPIQKLTQAWSDKIALATQVSYFNSPAELQRAEINFMGHKGKTLDYSSVLSGRITTLHNRAADYGKELAHDGMMRQRLALRDTLDSSALSAR